MKTLFRTLTLTLLLSASNASGALAAVNLYQCTTMYLNCTSDCDKLYPPTWLDKIFVDNDYWACMDECDRKADICVGNLQPGKTRPITPTGPRRTFN
jgi:hypothetical protein